MAGRPFESPMPAPAAGLLHACFTVRTRSIVCEVEIVWGPLSKCLQGGLSETVKSMDLSGSCSEAADTAQNSTDFPLFMAL